LATLLEARRKNNAEVRARLMHIYDEDGFLKLLDDILIGDHDAISDGFLLQGGSKDELSIVRYHQNWLNNQEIMERLTEHFCGIISEG
jgi:hypothetical protein